MRETKQLITGLIIGVCILVIGGFMIAAEEKEHERCNAIDGGLWLTTEKQCVRAP